MTEKINGAEPEPTDEDDAANEEAEGTDLFPDGDEADKDDEADKELPDGALSVDLPGEQPSSVPLPPESS